MTLTPADWLTFPQQKLRTITGGAVYHSGLGELDALRDRLRYYPRDVWLYLMAAGWTRISQEEAFIGRTGDVGDELGSRVIAARLIRDLMMLCFLIERVYAPYSKWFGTGFSKLACAPTLTPIFQRVLSAETWREREVHHVRSLSASSRGCTTRSASPSRCQPRRRRISGDRIR